MTELERRAMVLTEEFDSLGDGFLRYSYLVELAGLAPELPPELLQDENLVSGCQSRVWLDVGAVDGKLTLTAHSDTRIICGFLEVLRVLYDGLAPAEAAASTVDVLDLCRVGDHLDSHRNIGIRSIQSAILRRAAKLD